LRSEAKPITGNQYCNVLTAAALQKEYKPEAQARRHRSWGAVLDAERLISPSVRRQIAAAPSR
jgi:hypothetical protein